MPSGHDAKERRREITVQELGALLSGTYSRAFRHPLHCLVVGIRRLKVDRLKGGGIKPGRAGGAKNFFPRPV